MRWQRRVSVIDAHAEGEVGRVILAGVPEPPGATLFEKKRYLENEDDSLRRFILFEPRGGPAMSVNLVLPPCHPEADLGMIVMESTDYPPMSGSNAICVVTVALETGLVEMREPETKLVLDTPAGLVPVTAACRDGKCERVSLDNVPSFLLRRDLEIEVPEIGGIPAVVPRLTGRGWIFATHEFGCDPDDPFPEGFTLPDTWGPGISSGSTES